MKPRAERKARIRRIRREYTALRRLGRGRWEVTLKIDHQSFLLSDGVGRTFESKRAAFWMSTALAMALNRFKFGD